MINPLMIKKYLVMLGIAALAVVGAWLHGFGKGQDVGEVKVITKFIEANQESKEETDNVRKEIQSLTDHELDAELCALGIVRQNSGCQ